MLGDVHPTFRKKVEFDTVLKIGSGLLQQVQEEKKVFEAADLTLRFSMQTN